MSQAGITLALLLTAALSGYPQCEAALTLELAPTFFNQAGAVNLIHGVGLPAFGNGCKLTWGQDPAGSPSDPCRKIPPGPDPTSTCIRCRRLVNRPRESSLLRQPD